MKDFFQLEKHHTTITKEIFAGFTTFFAMSYILFLNPVIVSATGMPFGGIFAATVLASVICTLIMAFFANTPYAMAPGMGINTFITYTMCIGLNFHWKEAMAVVFISGIIHLLIMSTPLRKSFVKALPTSLKYASAVGIGIFIAYIGIKNAGFLSFTIRIGQYITTSSGAIIANSSTVPSLTKMLTFQHGVAAIGLFVTIYLLTLEKKTGDNYAAILLGILTATFIGIPLSVTEIRGIHLTDISTLIGFKEVFLSFLGDPGLLSLASDPTKALMTILMIAILLLTNIVDSISTIVGIGQLKNFPVFEAEENNKFETQKGYESKLDRAIITNSLGGIIAALLGTTTTTTFTESVTGVAAGGRTGLTSIVVALLFLLCLPLSNILEMIPTVAVAPALIVVGVLLISLVNNIDWDNLEQALPAAMIILFVPITYSIATGVIVGYIAHIIIQIAMGKARSVHPLLYIVSIIFISITLIKTTIQI